MSKWVMTSAECAYMLGVSTRTLRDYRAQGMPVAEDLGGKQGFRFDPQDVVSWVVARASAGSDDVMDQARETARLRARQAEKIELELSRMRREMVPIDVVTRPVAEWCKQAADVFRAIPHTLKVGNPSLTAMDLERVRGDLAAIQNELATLPDVSETVAKTYDVAQ